MGPMGVLTPHFGRAYGMGTAAKGVVVAAWCVTLSGESRCPHPSNRGGLSAPGCAPGRAAGLCGLRQEPRQMDAAGLGAQQQRGLFTLCCGRCGLALISGGISVKSV